jgi:hypothetical protein
MSSQITIYVVAFITFILLIGILKWLHYLTTNKYIIEQFDTNSATNHNVNVPINTSYSCKNMCGPNNRCSKTGGQCLSDLDCYGCKPKIQTIPLAPTVKISGLNEAGKLTTAISPTFSTLTTDIGTQAMPIENEPGYIKKPDQNQNPPEYFKGDNTWKNSFDLGAKLFDKRYNPGQQVYIKNYPKRHTLSGEFMYDGPPAANEYL